MIYLYLITGLAVIISLVASPSKTLQAAKISLKRFVTILPAFLLMLILVSVGLFLVPDQAILASLGQENKYLAMLLASLIGSLLLMPGFIVFPLCGLLLQKGVAYMVLSAFTTTLMMVGVLTYPVEKQYFGLKVTVIRNLISFGIALIVAVATGFFFGEIMP